MLRLSNLRPEIDGKQAYIIEKSTSKKEKPKKDDRPLKRIEEFTYKNGKILEEEIKLFYPEKSKDQTSDKLAESSRKSKFEVMLDFMKLRAAGINLDGEKKEQTIPTQATHGGSSGHRSPPGVGANKIRNRTAAAKSHNNLGSPIQPKMTKTEKYDLSFALELKDRERIDLAYTIFLRSTFRDSVLPFTHHHDEINMGTQYTVKKDTLLIHQQVEPRITEIEAYVKFKIIHEIYLARKKVFGSELKNHKYKLFDFAQKNKKEIDLKRASLLLKTPKDTMNSILKKEDMERKMKELNSSKTDTDKRDNRDPFDMFIQIPDHLPFANLMRKIASELPDAPKFPTYQIMLSYEEFRNIYVKKYFDKYKEEYIRITTEAKSSYGHARRK